MMKKGEKVKNTRQPYRKPMLEQVQLFVEELVLLTCKIKGAGRTPECNPNAVEFCIRTSAQS